MYTGAHNTTNLCIKINIKYKIIVNKTIKLINENRFV